MHCVIVLALQSIISTQNNVKPTSLNSPIHDIIQPSQIHNFTTVEAKHSTEARIDRRTRTMATTEELDPLRLLPAELILHVLEFAAPSTLASLTRVSRAWHQFIDMDHQDTIYASPRKTDYPRGAKDFAFLSSGSSFSKYFQGVLSWKDLCKRQTLLSRNWTAVNPETRESIVQVGRNRVWRFKPDFKRRIFLSTSHDGGFHVTDMDTGHIIWELPNTEVRPFAHLEYQDGTAVWDRYGNALEVGR